MTVGASLATVVHSERLNRADLQYRKRLGTRWASRTSNRSGVSEPLGKLQTYRGVFVSPVRATSVKVRSDIVDAGTFMGTGRVLESEKAAYKRDRDEGVPILDRPRPT